MRVDRDEGGQRRERGDECDDGTQSQGGFGCATTDAVAGEPDDNGRYDQCNQWNRGAEQGHNVPRVAHSIGERGRGALQATTEEVVERDDDGFSDLPRGDTENESPAGEERER